MRKSVNKELPLNKEVVYRNIITILFSDLSREITNVLDNGSYTIDNEYRINAYLSSLLNAIASFAGDAGDSWPAQPRQNLYACEYVNNKFKHDCKVYTYIQYESGGFEFPMTFPLISPKSDFIWFSVADMDNRNKEKYDAYSVVFAGKPVLKSLKSSLEIMGVI